MCVNTKELCKHIKQSANRYLIWTVENGVHYITNRHWAVKFTELPRDVLISLFAVYARMPQEGISLVRTVYGDEERPAVSLEKIYAKSAESLDIGTITSIIVERDKEQYRVLKTPNAIIKLNNKYMSMIDKDINMAKCSGKNEPVFFGDNQVILLPVRADEPKENETINELIAG